MMYCILNLRQNVKKSLWNHVSALLRMQGIIFTICLYLLIRIYYYKAVYDNAEELLLRKAKAILVYYYYYNGTLKFI